MFPIESFQNTVRKIVSILQDLNIVFHFSGGITSVAYGEPRMTQDIDIVLNNQSTTEQFESFIEAPSKSDFLFTESVIKEATDSKKMFQLIDTVESPKPDMYPREMIDGELSRSEVAEVFEGFSVPIVSRRDTAASKLMWARKGSLKSRGDFRQIMLNLNRTTSRLSISLRRRINWVN